jgi:NAD(P)-dependent dehydrogenase (short-subunit alcohol dehydrogenase family)
MTPIKKSTLTANTGAMSGMGIASEETMDSFLGFEPGAPIVVTGAGSGIGRSLACMAARMGLRVGVWDVNSGAAAETASQIASGGGRALALEVDVADEESVSRGWERTVREFGDTYHLVNNAGPASSVQRVLEEGAGLCLRCARLPTEVWLKYVPNKGTRSMVLISSIAGSRYGAAALWYSAGKAALIGYMRALAAERPGNIRCNAVAPDLIATPRTVAFVTASGGNQWPANPMKRVGRAEDVASAALFLVSPAAEYINGQVLEIDGGGAVVGLAKFRGT